jgi:hypothetical protein
MCGHAMYIGKNRTINGGVLWNRITN